MVMFGIFCCHVYLALLGLWCYFLTWPWIRYPLLCSLFPLRKWNNLSLLGFLLVEVVLRWFECRNCGSYWFQIGFFIGCVQSFGLAVAIAPWLPQECSSSWCHRTQCLEWASVWCCDYNLYFVIVFVWIKANCCCLIIIKDTFYRWLLSSFCLRVIPF